MKINEILREAGEFGGFGPDTAEQDDMGASPHAAGNLEFGLSDMAGREFMAMEQDPTGYFSERGNPISPEQAQQISQTLASVDDNTLDLMTKSKIIQRAIEANYDDQTDSSFIDLNSMMEVLGKVQARMAR